MVKIEKSTIDALAASLVYHTHHFTGTTVTVAVAVLPNGFAVGFGKSACLDPAWFNANLGRDVAREHARKDAVETLWQLEGYKVKTAVASGADNDRRD